MRISIVDCDGNPMDVAYETMFSAGFDIRANESVTVVRNKAEVTKVKTGMFLKVEGEPEDPSRIPELQIRSRSGLAAKGLVVVNSPGTVDLDYKGEIIVLLTLTTVSKHTFRVNKGDRIAQGVFSEVIRPQGIDIKGVERGSGGFGSTGVKQEKVEPSDDELVEPKIKTPPIKRKK